ncbi:MAG: RtcB family protein [Solirubrobacteraceae bacterium]|nr:RtcB family protein [Solirubrobacteraceae bacterium]
MNDALNEAHLTILGDHEPRTIEQLTRCAAAEPGARGVLCADGHVGYSQPIGGVVAYRDHISPSGVGYDIGCGNTAVRLDLKADALRADLPRVMDEIVERISFGVGRSNGQPVDHDVIEAISDADFAPQRKLVQKAAAQLGTVGAGNHYVDLFSDESGDVWIGVHFGSRGFGHATASGFLSLIDGGGFDERGKDGEMDSPPKLLAIDSDLGQAYISAMTLAGDYARAGRGVVVDEVRSILGAEEVDRVENHHNYAWREEHGGDAYWVVRKGATPAFPGQRGFVGATMGEDAVILEGIEGDAAAAALHSTVHGAGRLMSRTKAAGKTRWVPSCTMRDCGFWMTGQEAAEIRDRGGRPECPHHPGRGLKKGPVLVSRGAIDYTAVRKELAAAGIELRGGAADEAPLAYKRLDEMLGHHADSVRILHRLTPMGVAMAGADVKDPYKD